MGGARRLAVGAGRAPSGGLGAGAGAGRFFLAAWRALEAAQALRARRLRGKRCGV